MNGHDWPIFTSCSIFFFFLKSRVVVFLALWQLRKSFERARKSQNDINERLFTLLLNFQLLLCVHFQHHVFVKFSVCNQNLMVRHWTHVVRLLSVLSNTITFFYANLFYYKFEVKCLKVQPRKQTIQNLHTFFFQSKIYIRTMFLK